MEMFKKLAGYIRAWFVVSVWIVGAPSVLWFSGIGIVRSVFSVQCAAVGNNCDAGWSAPPKVVVDLEGYSSDGYTYEEPHKRK